MKAAGLSDVGKMRQNNEDSYFFNPDKKLFIVADGLGGHSAGEVASNMSVTHLSTDPPQNIDELVERLTEANIKVYDEAQKLGNDMATTTSSLMVYENKAHVAHVGDSRVYLIRTGNVYCITDDHTPVMESVRSGIITEEQAKYHPLRHMLSRTIGTQPQVDIDVMTVDVEVDDIFLLCTDGLSNLLEETDMFNVVSVSPTLEDGVQNLINLANERGGTDNITVVLVQVEASDILSVDAILSMQ